MYYKKENGKAGFSYRNRTRMLLACVIVMTHVLVMTPVRRTNAYQQVSEFHYDRIVVYWLGVLSSRSICVLDYQLYIIVTDNMKSMSSEKLNRKA